MVLLAKRGSPETGQSQSLNGDQSGSQRAFQTPKNATILYALVGKNGLKNTQVVLTGVTPGGEHKVPNQASLDRTKGGKSKVTKGSRPPQVRESRYAQQVGPGDQFPRRRGFFGRLFSGPAAYGPQGYYRPPPTRGY